MIVKYRLGLLRADVQGRVRNYCERYVYNLKAEIWAKTIIATNAEITFSIHWQSPSDSNINSVGMVIKLQLH